MTKYSNLFNRTFNIDNNHKKLTIWQIYHKEEQIKKYNLIEDKNKFLFNTSNIGYDGKCINQLNQIICEACCILYPYLNNLKSDIIGFQHYRRYFDYDNLKIKEIKNGKFQIFLYHDVKIEDIHIIKNEKYLNIANHCLFWGSYLNGFYSDIIEFMESNYPQFLQKEKEAHIMIHCGLFVCDWNNYTIIAKFIWDYINFIANKYKFDLYNDIEWANYIKEHFIDYNYNNNVCTRFLYNKENYFGFMNWVSEPYESEYSFRYALYRIFSFHIEFIISMLIYNLGYIYDKNNKCIEQW